MTQTTNFHLNQWSPEDYVRRTDFNADNAKIDAALAAAGNCRIVTGSYTGTGTSGVNGQNTLTFDFTPRIVFLNTELVNPSNTIPRYFALLCPASKYAFDANHRGGVTWGENSVSWYSDGPSYQMNTEGTTYQYIAIGTV